VRQGVPHHLSHAIPSPSPLLPGTTGTLRAPVEQSTPPPAGGTDGASGRSRVGEGLGEGLGVGSGAGLGCGVGCGCGASGGAGWESTVSGVLFGPVVCSVLSVVAPPPLVSSPPPHALIRMISTMISTSAMIMVRRVFPCGCSGGGGTPGGLGVFIRPASGIGGGGPVGTSGSGLWASPQLGQKLAASPIAVPQFSQNRLFSDTAIPLLLNRPTEGSILTAPLTPCHTRKAVIVGYPIEPPQPRPSRASRP
jgi:hypothetical protein